jgi:hypothetical protein
VAATATTPVAAALPAAEAAEEGAAAAAAEEEGAAAVEAVAADPGDQRWTPPYGRRDCVRRRTGYRVAGHGYLLGRLSADRRPLSAGRLSSGAQRLVVPRPEPPLSNLTHPRL